MDILADLAVASAGEDKKISLWCKNGQSIGTVSLSGSEAGDILEVPQHLQINSQIYRLNCGLLSLSLITNVAC